MDYEDRSRRKVLLTAGVSLLVIAALMMFYRPAREAASVIGLAGFGLLLVVSRFS
ncbi:hypothetical protein GCM10010124_35350 [Pilimelia terevasa]|uniref:Uncharacterized protein n=1 Tax=Pilimelia terevasa TaxID=53372 RepID=A0A8J3BTF6_9ACTN|nr:hypothetical protein [Pilimelia terevasa]GGK39612.1 hypothetical protein GCM10010124_35350 [Pilimelia terevasa]